MKGFLRTIESVSAVLIIMSFLLLIGGSYLNSVSNVDMSIVGYDELLELDTRGDLRTYAAAGNTDAINDEINMRGYNHSISICRYGGTCSGNLPDAENIFVSNYMISGENSYDPMVIRMYIWRGT